MSSKHIKFDEFREDVSWIPIAHDLGELNDAEVNHVLHVQVSQLNVSCFL